MRSRERTYAVLQGTIHLGRFPVCPFRILGPNRGRAFCASFLLAMLNVWSVGAAKQVEVEVGGERTLVHYIITDIISNPVTSEPSSGDMMITLTAPDIHHRSHDTVN